MGKFIVFEGTDCSGKETQTKLLVESLQKKGYSAVRFSFPNYDSPTGKVLAGPFLGKFGESYFKGTTTTISPYIASLYYSADRMYNKTSILEAIEKYDYVILDRYMYSNLVYQGGKLKTKEEKEKFYSFMEKLEFEMLSLPKPDQIIFLHMPTDCALKLRYAREEKADENEKNVEYLRMCEQNYLELCERYHFEKIACEENGRIKTIEEIHKLVCEKII